MEHWEKNYYITAFRGALNGSSFVVMSKGMPFFILILCYDCLFQLKDYGTSTH